MTSPATVTAATGDTTSATPPAVVGQPRVWLRVEGAAALVAGLALYAAWGGQWLWLLPLLLAPDISMLGYLRGPGAGAWLYNLAHHAGVALAVLGLGAWLGVPALGLAGAVLLAHVGMDRALGHGLKYPTAFQDTHLGRIGRGRR